MSTLPQTADSRSFAVVRTYLLRRPTLIAAALCLLSFTAFWVAQRAAGVSMIDLMVYRAEGWTVRNGQDLYAMRATDAELPTTYPPFAALLFMPLTLLDTPGMRTLATAGNLVLSVVLVGLALRLTGRPLRLPRPAATLLLAALAVWCEPVWTTLRYGQINLLLVVLVLWDLTRRPGSRWAGAGVGLAAGVKLTPALFVVFLALYGLALGRSRMRRTGGGAACFRNAPLRQAAVASGVFLLTVVLAAVLLPGDSRRFWTDAVFRSDRVGQAVITDNQSLRGVLARLLHTADPGWVWIGCAALVTGLGLCVAVAAALAGPRRLPHAPAWAGLSCAVTALLVSPVSWSHHWVWCVPVLLLLGAEAVRRSGTLPGARDTARTSLRGLGGDGTAWWRGGAPWWSVTAVAALSFCSYALWWVPHAPGDPTPPELRQGVGDMVLSAVYPLAGTGFLLLAALVSVRALRRPEPYAPDSCPALPAGGSGAQAAGARAQAVAKE